MSVNDVEKCLIEILAEALAKRPDEISPDARTRTDLGIDSLTAAAAILEIEDVFGIEVEDPSVLFRGNPSVSDLADRLHEAIRTGTISE